MSDEAAEPAQAAEPAPAGHLLQLPQDVMIRIALLVAPIDVDRLACTCKTLQRVLKDESIWRTIAARDLPEQVTPSTWLQQQGHRGGHDGDQWPPCTYRYGCQAHIPRQQLATLMVPSCGKHALVVWVKRLF
jgi:hypothetical protein